MQIEFTNYKDVLLSYYKLASQEAICFWPPFAAQTMTPRSRKSGNGLLLRCRSWRDSASGHDTNIFVLALCQNKKTGKSSFIWRSCPLAQSIRRGRIRRERSLIVLRESRTSSEWQNVCRNKKRSVLAWHFRAATTVLPREFSIHWPRESRSLGGGIASKLAGQ